ncbi:MAG: MFS transporter [Proteobacteria bacterium]|nr:MFS transporter [Pseudomonadota bacterium]
MPTIKELFYKKAHGSNHHWWAFSVTSVSCIITTYDIGAVSICLPRVMTSFQTSLGVVSWVLLSYLLTNTSLLLPASRLGDMIGRKKIYIVGFIVFVSGSALCGFAQSAAQLILFRIFQAAGAAMLQTNTFAIISAVFPAKDRGKGLGFEATVASIGVTSGPAIGGLIVDTLGWRGIFFLNIPLGLAGIVMAHLILKEEIISEPPEKRTSGHFDLAGASLATLAIGSLLVCLTLGQGGNWSSWKTLLFLGLAALALITFPWLESGRTHPMVDIKLFKNRTFAFSNAARLISFIALSASALLMPFFLQLVLGYSPFQAGLLIAPASLVMAVASPISGWLTNRINTRTLTSIGMGLTGLSFYGMSRLTPLSGYMDILGLLGLLGLGMAIFQTPNNTAVMDSVPRKSFGVASGILAVVRESGRSLGTALASTIVVSSMFASVGKVSLYELKREGAVLQGGDILWALADGIEKTFIIASFFCIIGILFSVVIGKTERDRGTFGF